MCIGEATLQNETNVSYLDQPFSLASAMAMQESILPFLPSLTLSQVRVQRSLLVMQLSDVFVILQKLTLSETSPLATGAPGPHLGGPSAGKLRGCATQKLPVCY